MALQENSGRAGESQPRSRAQEESRGGGAQGEHSGNGEGGLPAPQTAGVPPAKPSSPGPPVTACYQGAGSSLEEGRNLTSVTRLLNLTRQAQFHLLSQDTPPFPLVSQRLT